MASTRPIGGYGEVRYNGTVIGLRGDLVWNFQNFTYEGVAGRDGRVHGSIATPMVPFIEGTFTFDGSYTTADLQAIVDATISVQLATKMSLVLRGARVQGEIQPEGDEGKLKLRFIGTNGDELPPTS